MRRIAILGGTFDPPHVGHLILAEYAAEAISADRLLIVLAADPPHKTHELKTPVEHRLAMMQRAIVDNPRFVLSRVDIDRPGPHYSVDTVQIIQSEYPGAELYFVMGGDSLRDLPKWRRPAEFIRLCRLAVMRRPGDALPEDMHRAVLPELAERVTMIHAPLLQISSTEIVERLQQGMSARYLVPDAVLEYIKRHKLYG
jgi:nicotinate-nucleotide adenylyltransferase